MSSSTADVITYTVSFTVAAALIALGLLHLAGRGPRQHLPRARAVSALLTGGGVVLCTLARVPATDRPFWDTVLGLPGMLLIGAGGFWYWRTR